MNLERKLSSLLEEPPSSALWARINKTLDGINHRTDFARAVERCDPVLRSWPVTIEREAPENWVKDLLAGQSAPQLRLTNLVHLQDIRLSEQDVRLLANSSDLAQVWHLSLVRCWFLDAGLHALAASPHFTKLTHLALDSGGFGLTSAASEALFRSRVVERVRYLVLNQNLLGTPGLEQLARWRNIHRVKHLGLQGTCVDSGGLAKLVTSNLSELEMLNLNGNRIGDAGAELLARTAGLSSLLGLQIGGNQVAQDGIRALSRASHLQSLRLLDLSHNPVGADGASALASSTAFPKLERLLLRGASIGAEGARALATSPHLHPAIRRDWA